MEEVSSAGRQTGRVCLSAWMESRLICNWSCRVPCWFNDSVLTMCKAISKPGQLKNKTPEQTPDNFWYAERDQLSAFESIKIWCFPDFWKRLGNHFSLSITIRGMLHWYALQVFLLAYQIENYLQSRISPHPVFLHESPFKAWGRL